jgi:hypothetical protein
MIAFLSIPIAEEHLDEPGLEGCEAFDHTTIMAGNDESPHCTLTPAYVLEMRIGEDITVATVVCLIHYNAFKINISEGGIGYDIDSFGELT